MAELAKYTSMMHMELNRTHTGAMMKMTPRGSRICESSCRPTPNDSQLYEMIRRKITLWVQTITQRPRLLHVTYCVGTRSRHHHVKHTYHPGRWKFSIMKKQVARKYQGIMENDSQRSRDTADRKLENMQENSRNPHLVHAWGNNYCRWDSPWLKLQRPYQWMT